MILGKLTNSIWKLIKGKPCSVAQNLQKVKFPEPLVSTYQFDQS